MRSILPAKRQMLKAIVSGNKKSLWITSFKCVIVEFKKDFGYALCMVYARNMKFAAYTLQSRLVVVW